MTYESKVKEGIKTACESKIHRVRGPVGTHPEGYGKYSQWPITRVKSSTAQFLSSL